MIPAGIDLAAARLTSNLCAPAGSFSVISWQLDDEPPKLRVFYNPMYRYLMANIPSE